MNRLIDLNLFRVFICVYECRNVSHAAGILGLSQSAVSNALARLRYQLDDPLFIRVKSGVRPTTEADRIFKNVKSGMQYFEQLWDRGEPFEPGDFEKTVRITMSELEQLFFLPKMIEKLSTQAPKIKIEVMPYSSNVVEQLRSSRTDFILAHIPGTLPEDIENLEINQQDFLFVMSKKHPAVQRPLSLKSYCGFQHLLVSPSKGGFRGLMDQELMRLGKKRQVSCSIPSFLSALSIVEKTELVATLPRAVVESSYPQKKLQVFKLPFKNPKFSISLYWNKHNNNDPFFRWFQGFIKNSLCKPNRGKVSKSDKSPLI